MLLKKNAFVQGVLTLISGNVLAYVLGFILTPFIVRLYGPAEYGAFSLVLSIASIFGFFSAFRYSEAIVVAANRVEYYSLLKISFFLMLITFGFNLIFFFFFGENIISFFNKDKLEINITLFIFLIPVIIFITELSKVFEMANIYDKNYLKITKGKVFGTILSKVTIYSIGYFIFIDVIGFVIGHLLHLITQILFYYNEKIKLEKIDAATLKAVFKKNIKYITHITPSGLLAILSVQLPNLTIARYFGVENLGFFALSTTILSIPLTLVGFSFGQAFMKEAKLKLDHSFDSFSKFVAKMFLIVAAISFMIALLLNVISYDLFVLVGGDEWGKSGTIAQVLSLTIFFQLLFVVFSTTFKVLRKEQMILYINIVLFVAHGVFFYMAKYLTLDQYLYIYVIYSSLIFFLGVLVTLFYFKNKITLYYFVLMSTLSVCLYYWILTG